MKNRIKFLATALVAFTFTFTSCDDDNTTILPVETHEDAYGDVILKKMSMMGTINYIPIFMAGGNTVNATGCTVTDPNGTEYPINEFWAGPGSLTGKGVAATTKPPMGTYTFKLKFADGYEKTVTDVLTNVETSLAMPITVTRIPATASESEKIQLNWTAVPNTDLICIKLTELDIEGTKPLFKMAKLDASLTTYTIKLDGGTGWLRPTSQLTTGTEYYITVAAKKVEDGKVVDGASKDFAHSACSKVKIVY
jgi:hypothetical protein